MDYDNETRVTEEKALTARELEASLLKRLMTLQEGVNALEKRQLTQQGWNAPKNGELTNATRTWEDNAQRELRRMEAVGNSDCGSNYGNRNHYDQSFVEEEERRAMYSYRDTEEGNWWCDSGASEESANDNKLCYGLGSEADRAEGMKQTDDWRTSNGQTGNWRAKEKQVYVEQWERSERAKSSGWFRDRQKGKKTEEAKVSRAEWMAMQRLCDGARLQQENLKLKAKLWKQVNREKRLRAEHAELRGGLMLLMSEEKELMSEQLEGIRELKYKIEAIEQRRMTTDQTRLHQVIESLKEKLEQKTAEGEKQKWEIGVLKERLRVTPKEEKLKKELQRTKDVNNSLRLQIQMCQEEFEQVGKCSKNVLTEFWRPEEMMTKRWGQRVSQNCERVEDGFAGQMTIIDTRKIQCEDETEKPLLLQSDDDDEGDWSQSEESFEGLWRDVIQEVMPKDQAKVEEEVPKGRAATETGQETATPEEKRPGRAATETGQETATPEEKRPGRAATETGQETATPEEKRPGRAATETGQETATPEEKRPGRAATETGQETATPEEKRPGRAATETGQETATPEEKRPERAATETGQETATPEEKRPGRAATETGQETATPEEKRPGRAATETGQRRPFWRRSALGGQLLRQARRRPFWRTRPGRAATEMGLGEAIPKEQRPGRATTETGQKQAIPEEQRPGRAATEMGLGEAISEKEKHLGKVATEDQECPEGGLVKEQEGPRPEYAGKEKSPVRNDVDAEDDARQKEIQEEDMTVWPLLPEQKLVIDLLNKRMPEKLTRREGPKGDRDEEMGLGKTRTGNEESPEEGNLEEEVSPEEGSEEVSPEEGNVKEEVSPEEGSEEVSPEEGNSGRMIWKRGCAAEKTLAGQVMKRDCDEEKLRAPTRSDSDELNETGSDSGTVMDSEDGLAVKEEDGQNEDSSSKKKSKKKEYKKVQKKRKNAREKEIQKELQKETRCVECGADRKTLDGGTTEKERDALIDNTDGEKRRKLEAVTLTTVEVFDILEPWMQDDGQVAAEKTTSEEERGGLEDEKSRQNEDGTERLKDDDEEMLELHEAERKAFWALPSEMQRVIKDGRGEYLKNDLICWRMEGLAAHEVDLSWEEKLSDLEYNLLGLVEGLLDVPEESRKEKMAIMREFFLREGYEQFEDFRRRVGLFEPEEFERAGLYEDPCGDVLFRIEPLARESGGVLENVDSLTKVAHFFNCYSRSARFAQEMCPEEREESSLCDEELVDHCCLTSEDTLCESNY
ncbi:hypothetical protein TYRP_016955 [Tyrophagus putrescentiae]|nr:hypothetical protein TYRP_016955 [Tyrophagus putrescentiae]